jgi:hypothetical protein
METKAKTIIKKYDSQGDLIEKTTKTEENSTSKIRPKTITKLLIDAYKKAAEDRLWQQWLVERPYFDPFVSWENYKKEFMKPPAPKVDAETILKDAEKIKASDTGRG